MNATEIECSGCKLWQAQLAHVKREREIQHEAALQEQADLQEKNRKLDAALRCAQATIDKWTLALYELTPGGSEFHDDPENCLAHVRARMDGVMEQVKKRKNAQAENVKLRAVVDASRKTWPHSHELDATLEALDDPR